MLLTTVGGVFLRRFQRLSLRGRKNELLATWVPERRLSRLVAAVGNRRQGGIRHREHVSPVRVLVVGRSAHLT